MGLFVLCVLPSFMGGMVGGPFGGPPDIFRIFPLLFFVLTLIIAAASFYNAFSERGIARYEVEIEEGGAGTPRFCRSCGRPVAPDDRFCRQCGTELD